jgi:hypothetical protein
MLHEYFTDEEVDARNVRALDTRALPQLAQRQPAPDEVSYRGFLHYYDTAPMSLVAKFRYYLHSVNETVLLFSVRQGGPLAVGGIGGGRLLFGASTRKSVISRKLVSDRMGWEPKPESVAFRLAGPRSGDIWTDLHNWQYPGWALGSFSGGSSIRLTYTHGNGPGSVTRDGGDLVCTWQGNTLRFRRYSGPSV